MMNPYKTRLGDLDFPPGAVRRDYIDRLFAHCEAGFFDWRHGGIPVLIQDGLQPASPDVRDDDRLMIRIMVSDRFFKQEKPVPWESGQLTLGHGFLFAGRG